MFITPAPSDRPQQLHLRLFQAHKVHGAHLGQITAWTSELQTICSSEITIPNHCKEFTKNRIKKLKNKEIPGASTLDEVAPLLDRF